MNNNAIERLGDTMKQKTRKRILKIFSISGALLICASAILPLFR